MEINENIKKCIKAHGYTLKQFAEIAGVSYIGLQKNLSPTNKMRIDTILSYAKILGVSISELLGEKLGDNCDKCTCPNCGTILHISVK